MLMHDNPALAGAGAGRLSVPSAAIIVAALLAPFLLYWSTAASIVSVWNSSETFAHGYAILPISLWLIWRRREVFARIPVAPAWSALTLLALCGAAWLVARAGEVQVVMQYAFVAMFPVMALVLLGRRLAGSLAFPLLFLLFAVPFGEVFVQPLINFTADFTVAAVQATGIPVLRNGTQFELPTGNWSVVEACSGVRYLISSITLGCLYAYLSYRSITRRALFIALSIVVPIIANGLRAYMIVMIGHTSDMALATGVDHLIYGWLFFGLVMFIMFWIGSFWREDEAEPPAPGSASAVSSTVPAAAARPVIGAAIAAVLVCATWPLLAIVSDKAAHNPAPVQLDGSQLVSRPSGAPTWSPEYMAPDATLKGAYTALGSQVDLNVLYYRNQGPEKRLISSVNRVDLRKEGFQHVASSGRVEEIGGQRLALRETRVKGPLGNYLVWHWNWVDGRFTANDYVGKLWQAKAKLMMHGDDGAMLMIATPVGEHPETARAALRAFLQSNLAPLQATLEATRER